MATSITGIKVPMKSSDMFNQPITPKVQIIENPTTNKGRNTPVQLRKESINKKIHNPMATGVKTRISRCMYSMIVALVIGKLET